MIVLLYKELNQSQVYIYLLPLEHPSHPTPVSHLARSSRSTELSLLILYSSPPLVILHMVVYIWSFPGDSAINSACMAGAARDVGSIPGFGSSPGGGHGNPPQCSYLENPTGKGALRSIVHGVTKSQTRLK